MKQYAIMVSTVQTWTPYPSATPSKGSCLWDYRSADSLYSMEVIHTG